MPLSKEDIISWVEAADLQSTLENEERRRLVVHAAIERLSFLAEVGQETLNLAGIHSAQSPPVVTLSREELRKVSVEHDYPKRLTNQAWNALFKAYRSANEDLSELDVDEALLARYQEEKLRAQPFKGLFMSGQVLSATHLRELVENGEVKKAKPMGDKTLSLICLALKGKLGVEVISY